MTELDPRPTHPDQSWCALDADATLTRLASSPVGLDSAERTARLARYGPNTTHSAPTRRWWTELGESLTEPLQLLLVVVAVLSAVFGQVSDAIAIAVVILLVVGVETLTELRAARAITALKRMTAPSARVSTPGGIRELASGELVPGDVIVLEPGDVVPADARVLHARGLRVDESQLTGESTPVGKDEHPVLPHTDLAERSSQLHAGSPVLAGQARAVVVATGASTQLGSLGRLVDTSAEPPSPLQRALGQLARVVLVLAVAASTAVGLVGLITGQPWREMLLAGLSVAFATVPEELPILVVVLLAVGGRQLARRGGLLRRLAAGETLGAVTTVVTDKTGTLTENQLRLVEVIGPRREVLDVALHCQPREASSREPMDAELRAAATAEGALHRGEVVATFPFDPTRKLTSQAWRNQAAPGTAGIRLVVGGAPEAVLARCVLADGARANQLATVAERAVRGLRVLAFATRTLPDVPIDRDDAETDLLLVGLVAFADPLRSDAREAVHTLTRAGVSTIMVTGDHPQTARAIAGQAGLASGPLLTGAQVSALDDQQLDAQLRPGTIIARATPQTKHRIVGILQRRHDIVAVTGDGANDAPALAAADVGIAMGRRGADLARAAADLVLTNDSYRTVTAAIATGRNITAQLRRAVSFYLGAKLALVIVMLAALAMGRPPVFRPVHIIVLELFMDLGASVAFVAEPAAPGAMHRPPRPPGARFLDPAAGRTIGLVAAALTAITLPAYLITDLYHDADTARAAAVLAWLTGHALIAWTMRTQPGLRWPANAAFPAWAAAATLTGLAAAYTPAGALIDLHALPADALGPLALLVGAVVAGTALLVHGLRLATQL